MCRTVAVVSVNVDVENAIKPLAQLQNANDNV